MIARAPESGLWRDLAEYDLAKETGLTPLAFDADPAWLYVRDHCNAVNLLLQRGRVGHAYNIGGASERPEGIDTAAPRKPAKRPMPSIRGTPESR